MLYSVIQQFWESTSLIPTLSAYCRSACMCLLTHLGNLKVLKQLSQDITWEVDGLQLSRCMSLLMCRGPIFPAGKSIGAGEGANERCLLSVLLGVLDRACFCGGCVYVHCL